jgi:hypothetical protein
MAGDFRDFTSRSAKWDSGDEVEYAKSRDFQPIHESPGELGRTSDYLGRKNSDLDMAISKWDPLACSRGATEPHLIGISKPLETLEFWRTVLNPRSPELRREMSQSEKNKPPQRIGSPELKSEIAANTGLNFQQSRAENIRLRPSWRREWDSNPRYGFPHTRFPSVRLKPLGHLSGCPLLKGHGNFCKGARPRWRKFQQLFE